MQLGLNMKYNLGVIGQDTQHHQRTRFRGIWNLNWTWKMKRLGIRFFRGNQNPTWELDHLDVECSRWDDTPGAARREFWSHRQPQSRRKEPNLNERRPRQWLAHAYTPYIGNRTSAVTPPKNIMAATIPIFQPYRSAKPYENRPNEPKHEYSLDISMAPSPSMLCARRFEALSIHPRDPGGDGFRAWAAKRNARLAAARSQRPERSCLLSSVFVNRALCDLLR